MKNTKENSTKNEKEIKEQDVAKEEKATKKNLDEKTQVNDKTEAEDEAKQEAKETEESIEEKYEKMNDKYLRLAAEYDNYRKRTLKEKMELIKTAGEDILVNFLPVIDNMERAQKSVKESNDIESVKEGIDLIYKNLIDFIKSRGVKEIEAVGEAFDTDLHEAVTKIPAPDDKQKGKVIDVIEKGYKLNDKVIRYAKVVVGQ